jgi:hypothetical protein
MGRSPRKKKRDPKRVAAGKKSHKTGLRRGKVRKKKR